MPSRCQCSRKCKCQCRCKCHRPVVRAYEVYCPAINYVDVVQTWRDAFNLKSKYDRYHADMGCRHVIMKLVWERKPYDTEGA